MEIERKFLVDAFPQLPLVREAQMEQGYLAVEPVVRIRSEQTAEKTSYRLCIKGKGTLVRREIELPLEKETYDELTLLLPAPPIRKKYRVYALPGGFKLECSCVDEGEPTSFFYAEVEFETLEQAKAFVPPAFLGREVTEEPGYTMAQYWKKKQQAKHALPNQNIF